MKSLLENIMTTKPCLRLFVAFCACAVVTVIVGSSMDFTQITPWNCALSYFLGCVAGLFLGGFVLLEIIQEALQKNVELANTNVELADRNVDLSHRNTELSQLLQEVKKQNDELWAISVKLEKSNLNYRGLCTIYLNYLNSVALNENNAKLINLTIPVYGKEKSDLPLNTAWSDEVKVGDDSYVCEVGFTDTYIYL